MAKDQEAKPIVVEVITYVPSEYYHCTHCEVTWQTMGLGTKIHQEQRESGLPEDLIHEYVALSAWARGIAERYGERIRIRLVDAASIEGFFKSVRYRFRRYPAFVVNGASYVGSDFSRVDTLISEHLEPVGLDGL